IFPNPFYSETTIRMNTVLKNAILTLYNSLGEKVNQAKISGQTVTLQRNNLPAGIYFFCIEQNNQTISSSKLIIAD
ncbi:MAG: T9SS type A sorting domain-containing protein, partial [Bacteroidia bacterium]|nr:T9SS type A sorting domain-containing protein [Bacteroidia bacterium]